MTEECRLFFHFLLFGAAAAAVYDVLRILRRLFTRGVWFVACEDGVYWLLTGASFFLLLGAENSGRLRGYLVLAAAIGAAVYGVFFGRPLMGFLSARILRVKNRLKKWRKAVTIKLTELRRAAGRMKKGGNGI